MKITLVILAWLVCVGHAAADASLKEMFGDAASCSDTSLQDYASRTCDSPETIAAEAVAKCQAKWDAVASKAIGPAPANVPPKEHARSLKTYTDAMEYEYSQGAALKAIDLRRADGKCGFD